MQMKHVTQVSSFFSPSTITGGLTSKSYILFCLCTFSFATPRPAQKRNVACLSKSMSCARHDQAPIQKHEQKTRHVKQSRDASYISGSFWNFGRFLSKPNTQDCVRCCDPCQDSQLLLPPCNVPRSVKGFALSGW